MALRVLPAPPTHGLATSRVAAIGLERTAKFRDESDFGYKQTGNLLLQSFRERPNVERLIVAVISNGQASAQINRNDSLLSQVRIDFLPKPVEAKCRVD